MSDDKPKQLPTADAAPLPTSPAAPAQADVYALAEKPSNITQLSADPDELSAQAKTLHLYIAGGQILGAIADALKLIKSPDQATASTIAQWYLNELFRSIKPRDAAEEMLIVQMAMVHQRIGNLSLQASEQVRTKNVAVINQAVDGACNVFRRQMLALAEYRRASTKPAAAGTENSRGEKNDGNEQGSTAAAPAALPALGSGIEVPANVGATSSSVGAEHGSANGSGQVAVKTQRAEARGVQPGPARRTSPAKRVDPANARRRRRAP
jgi:hypothetical protein